MSTSCGWEGKGRYGSFRLRTNVWVCRYNCEIPWEHVPYLSASAVVIHYEEALYQMYAPLPLPLLRGSHSRPIDRWHFLWPLSDLEGRGVRGQRFLADLQNYACTVRPRMTEFGTVTQVRKKHICRWSATQPRPLSKRAGPSVPHKLLESYLRQNCLI